MNAGRERPSDTCPATDRRPSDKAPRAGARWRRPASIASEHARRLGAAASPHTTPVRRKSHEGTWPARADKRAWKRIDPSKRIPSPHAPPGGDAPRARTLYGKSAQGLGRTGLCRVASFVLRGRVVAPGWQIERIMRDPEDFRTCLGQAWACPLFLELVF